MTLVSVVREDQHSCLPFPCATGEKIKLDRDRRSAHSGGRREGQGRGMCSTSDRNFNRPEGVGLNFRAPAALLGKAISLYLCLLPLGVLIASPSSLLFLPNLPRLQEVWRLGNRTEAVAVLPCESCTGHRDQTCTSFAVV